MVTNCVSPGPGAERYEKSISFSEGDSSLNEDARVILREYQAHFEVRNDAIGTIVNATAHSSDRVSDLEKLATERVKRVADFLVFELGFEDERILEKNTNVIRRDDVDPQKQRCAELLTFVPSMPGECTEFDANASTNR